MKRGIFVAPFGELFDPRVSPTLAARAEEAGWDGFFVWDHIHYSPPSLEVADPWVALTAIALATERLTIGPLVTPVSRRRPHKLARETITLDHLSGGRLVLGVGLGSDNHGEFEDFEEVVEPRERAQAARRRPRAPRRALARVLAAAGPAAADPGVDRRALPEPPPAASAPQRWDGLFPIDLPGPDALAELRDGGRRRLDLVVTNPAGTDQAPWEDAGATWGLTGFGRSRRAPRSRRRSTRGRDASQPVARGRRRVAGSSSARSSRSRPRERFRAPSADRAVDGDRRAARGRASAPGASR